MKLAVARKHPHPLVESGVSRFAPSTRISAIDDSSILKMDDPTGLGGERLAMGRNQNRSPCATMRAHDVEDEALGNCVDLAGRLVSEDDRWRCGKSDRETRARQFSSR